MGEILMDLTDLLGCKVDLVEIVDYLTSHVKVLNAIKS